MLPQETYQGQSTRSRRTLQRRAIAALALLIGLAFGGSPAMADWIVHYTVNPADGSGGLISGAGSTDATAITETNINTAQNSQITAAAKAGYVFSHWDQIRTDTEPDQDIGDWGSPAYYQGVMTPDSVWAITANFTPVPTSYTVSMTSAATSVTEGVNGSNTFTVHVSPAVQPGQWVKVKLRTYPSTAQPGGDDFTAPNGIPHTTSDLSYVEYTLNPGDDHLDITVAITDDNVVEDSQGFYLDGFNPTASSGSSASPALIYKYLTIVDNDTATVNVAKKNDGVEGGANAAFTVSTTANLETPVTANLSTVAGTAASPGDYTAISGQSVTLGAAATYSSRVSGDSRDVTVTVQNDGAVDGLGHGHHHRQRYHHRVDHGHRSAETAGNNGEPGRRKTGGIAVSFNVTGTATSGIDYTALSSPVTIAAGANAATVDVSGIVDDNVIETGGETVVVTLTGTNNPGATVNPAAPSATVTIADNDTATVSIEATDAAAGETPGNTGRFTVTLSDAKVAPAVGIVVNYSTGGTATAVTDYAALGGSVLIPSGSGTATISVVAVNGRRGRRDGDRDPDGDQQHRRFGGRCARSGGRDGQRPGDHRRQRHRHLYHRRCVGHEDDGDLSFTVTLSRAVQGGVQVEFYATADGTATVDDGDYGLASGTLSFVGLAGETETITVTPAADEKVEADETFTVSLSNVTPLVFGVPAGAIDAGDDSHRHDPQRRNGHRDIGRGDLLIRTKARAAPATDFTFSVTLNADVQGGFSLAYTTDDGSAKAVDGDYTDNDGTLTFAGTAGEAHLITVAVSDDSTLEADETFTVATGDFSDLAPGVDAGGLSVAGTPQTATIRNDDAADLTITNSLILAEGSTGGGTTDFVFTVTLNRAVQDGFSLAYTTDDGTNPDAQLNATSGDNDYVDNDGTLVFDGTAGETHTITVQVNQDNQVEGNEQFTVALGTATPVDAGYRRHWHRGGRHRDHHQRRYLHDHHRGRGQRRGPDGQRGRRCAGGVHRAAAPGRRRQDRPGCPGRPDGIGGLPDLGRYGRKWPRLHRNGRHPDLQCRRFQRHRLGADSRSHL